MKMLNLLVLMLSFSFLIGCASTTSVTHPTPSPEKITKDVICQYAKYASASSENFAGSLAVYATGKPDAPSGGICGKWSGYGFSWTPASWNIRARLALYYEKPVYVTSVTINGDYDICWRGVWLMNSQTGKEKRLLDSLTKDCILKILPEEDFLADMVVLESCGWAWSATDAVELCGTLVNK